MYAEQSVQIAVVGCSHNTAPVDVREVLFPDEGRVDDFFGAVAQGRFKADEAAIVLTCSRAEFYVVGLHPGLAASRVRDWLLERAPELTEHTYLLTGNDAARHLLAVCAGLDSIVLGEHEILGQVRRGLEDAKERGSVGPVMERLFQAGLKTGRRARRETDIGKGGTSLAFAAADTARREVPPSQRGRAVVVGAGQTGALAATHMVEAGWSDIVILNRTLARAEELAERLGAQALPLDDLQWAVRSAQVVVTAAGGEAPLVTKDTLTDRTAKPVIMLDLGRPRNIDAAVADVAGVSLWDLDRLQDVAEAYRRKRSLEIPRVEPIITEEASRFRAWMAHREVVPMVRIMRKCFAGIAEEELSKHQHSFAEPEREKLERFTRSLVNKLLHYPTCQLKELAEEEPGHDERIAAFSEIFASAGWSGDEASGEGSS